MADKTNTMKEHTKATLKLLFADWATNWRIFFCSIHQELAFVDAFGNGRERFVYQGPFSLFLKTFAATISARSTSFCPAQLSLGLRGWRIVCTTKIQGSFSLETFCADLFCWRPDPLSSQITKSRSPKMSFYPMSEISRIHLRESIGLLIPPYPRNGILNSHCLITVSNQKEAGNSDFSVTQPFVATHSDDLKISFAWFWSRTSSEPFWWILDWMIR